MQDLRNFDNAVLDKVNGATKLANGIGTAVNPNTWINYFETGEQVKVEGAHLHMEDDWAADPWADEHQRQIGTVTDLTYKDATGAVTQRVRYAYDANDRRISQEVDSDADGTYESVEGNVYDPDGSADNVVLMTDGAGNVTHRLLQGPAAHQVLADEDLSKAPSDVTRTTWLLADNQQSVRDVLDTAGTSLDHLVYDRYGNIVSQSSPSNTPRFTYTGMQADATTGLLYDFHRYYDATNGRFISQDPKAFDAGDSNLYRYVGNNPMDRIDPTGFEDEHSSGDSFDSPPSYESALRQEWSNPSYRPGLSPGAQTAWIMGSSWS